jgi:lipopolysaccharide transport system permease protein
MPGMPGALWAYRGFIVASAMREFQSKYRNSLLGAAWTVINPLAMIIVYTVIFSQTMRAKLPGVDSTFAYSIYLCAGVLTWGLFAEIVGRGQNVFLENANLLKKLSFPRLCLPVVVVANTEQAEAKAQQTEEAARHWQIQADNWHEQLLTLHASPSWRVMASLRFL